MGPRALGAPILIAAALAALGSGCGGSESGSETGETIPSASPPPAASPAPTVTDSSNSGIDPLEGAGTEPVSGAAEGTAIALVNRVAVARHEGYDRVVFQFRNALPGYRVEYVKPPLYEDGSGDPVDVAGSAFVVVRMEPSSGFDAETGEGEIVYEGRRRISGSQAGTSTVREAVRTGDFEAVLSWAVGLEDRVEFRVLTLDGPPRLVVDFRNH